MVIPGLGGLLLGKLGWLGGPLPKPLTVFMTKICDVPYPIYNLTKHSISYLWALGWHSCPRHNLWRALVVGLIDNDEKVASCKKKKNITTWRLECKNHTLFKIKRLKNHTVWGRTYLYSPYNEAVPRLQGGSQRVKGFDIRTWKLKLARFFLFSLLISLCLTLHLQC